MDISVVIPLLNEEESLPELSRWIDEVMNRHSYSYEILFIDDGSTDNSMHVIKELAQDNKQIKALSFNRNYGKSAALNEGFKVASGQVIVTMDADLQDSPDEIPELYKMIIEEGYDLVSGWKKKRYDPITKTIPTKLYNWTTRKLTRIPLHDFNCGLKAYKNAVVKSIEVYGEMHRYIPVMAKWNGFKNIGEKIVQHRARKYGKTKFGLERFINGMLDLLSILFVTRFRKKPMHFFGSLGVLTFIIGFIISAVLLGQKIYARFADVKISRDVVDKPMFYIALLLVNIGVVLFLAGFIGELIHNSNSDKKGAYLIKEKINFEK